MQKTHTFKKLATHILSLPSKGARKIVAIDGGGGAGKTTFATHLQREIPGSCILKIDDFYRPPQLREPLTSTEVINPNFDWARIQEILQKASTGNTDIQYQLYDFQKGILSDKTVTIPGDSVVLVEGVWSMQELLRNFYDYQIWLEAPPELRLQRGVARDGEHLRQVWEEEWLPIDEYYCNTYKPYLDANCCIDSEKSDFGKNRIVYNY